MNIFKKIFKIGIFIPKTIFEASQEGAEFLNKALDLEQQEVYLFPLILYLISYTYSYFKRYYRLTFKAAIFNTAPKLYTIIV